MKEPRFYFALPRLLAKWRGGDPKRAEKNAVEAWLAGLAVFGVSYLYFEILIPDATAWWARVMMFVALAFLVWLFWLLVLYVNSMILKSIQRFGLFRSLPMRRGQSVLIATTTAAMAIALVQRDSFASEIGAIWLTATALNLVAAAILAFSNGEPAHR
jgi:hypothetical protein